MVPEGGAAAAAADGGPAGRAAQRSGCSDRLLWSRCRAATGASGASPPSCCERCGDQRLTADHSNPLGSAAAGARESRNAAGRIEASCGSSAAGSAVVPLIGGSTE